MQLEQQPELGLISHECYPLRVRQSVVHRGRWGQTNGWALRHHSLSYTKNLKYIIENKFHIEVELCLRLTIC